MNIDKVNFTSNNVSGLVSAKGDLVTTTGSGLSNITVGANGNG